MGPTTSCPHSKHWMTFVTLLLLLAACSNGEWLAPLPEKQTVGDDVNSRPHQGSSDSDPVDAGKVIPEVIEVAKLVPEAVVQQLITSDNASRLVETTVLRHGDPIAFTDFEPDGKPLLITITDNEDMKLWNTATGTAVVTLDEHTEDLMTAMFSPNGMLLATASLDGVVKLWDVATGTAVATLTGHTAAVWTLAFSSNNALIASSSENGTIKLWDTVTGEEIGTLYGHIDAVSTMLFSPDGTQLAAASHDGTVMRWWLPSGQLIANRSTGHIYAGSPDVTFDPDGIQYAYTSENHTFGIVNFPNDSENYTVNIVNLTNGIETPLEGHTDVVTWLEFISNGALLVSVANDQTWRLWDVQTGEIIHTSDLEGVSRHGVFGKFTLALSLDETLLASGMEDNTIRLWDVATGTQIAILEGHTDTVIGVAFSPDGKHLSSTSADGTVKLWGVVMEDETGGS